MTLKELSVEIEGYEAFMEQIKILEKDAALQPLYILFTGSSGPDGKSWCPDCVKFERNWEKMKGSLGASGGAFMRVKVGPLPVWKDRDCPFRKNEKTRLSSIPTLVKWGTSKRLSDPQIQDSAMVQMLMED